MNQIKLLLFDCWVFFALNFMHMAYALLFYNKSVWISMSDICLKSFCFGESCDVLNKVPNDKPNKFVCGLNVSNLKCIDSYWFPSNGNFIKENVHSLKRMRSIFICIRPQVINCSTQKPQFQLVWDLTVMEMILYKKVIMFYISNSKENSLSQLVSSLHTLSVGRSLKFNSLQNSSSCQLPCMNSQHSSSNLHET